MRKIRIAQIGINKHSHGSQIFKTLKENPDVFDVAGYAIVENEREESLERLGCFEGYPELSLEEILNDESIEAVTVETDEIHLTKYARLAAEHGKHIHMEKPGSQNLCEFEEMIDAVRKGGKPFVNSIIPRRWPRGWLWRQPCLRPWRRSRWRRL